ncbi:MAG: Uma2 family endonuclease [Acidobacteriia bacterium]|nr:Uma2 family endonuclease [Terriglobia bacterium]
MKTPIIKDMATETLAFREKAKLQQHDRRKVWTRDEAAKLNDIFPLERFELIEGDLISKMGENPPHGYVLMVLIRILSDAFPGRVRVQSQIGLPDPEGILSEPLPDMVVLHRESEEFFERHPGPQDIALLIEVSDSSMQTDRETKARLYARCGIQLYWIIEIPRRRILAFQNPRAGEYHSMMIYEAHEQVSIGDVSIRVDSLFGKKE